MNHRRGAIARMAASLCATAVPVATARGTAFDRTLEHDGVAFRVRSANTGSINDLRIDLSGRAPAQSLRREIAGLVAGAHAADLDADGMPELYVIMTSAGSGSYGEVLGITVGADARVELIALADDPDSPALRGYQGHDRFHFEERALLRRFPVYRAQDPNARPGGGTRELRYRLSPPRPGSPRSLELADYSDRPSAP